jgi:SAM-dependent methyltransferase
VARADNDRDFRRGLMSGSRKAGGLRSPLVYRYSVSGIPPRQRIETAHFGAIDVEKRVCPLCHRNNDAMPDNPYSHSVWTIKDCANCGFVYIDVAPVYSALSDQMAWERTTPLEEARRAELRLFSYTVSKRTRFRMRILPRRTVNAYVTARADGGNVLDIGCGGGGSFRGMPSGFRLFGIEISRQAAQEADGLFRKRGGHVVNAPALHGLAELPANLFTAVTLRSYLEHELHPLPVLQEVSRVLAPAGFAVVKVPNYGSLNRKIMGRKWCGFRYPDHLNYFTPATLRQMAARCGLTTSFGLFGRLATGDNMWAILTRVRLATT